MRPRSAILSGFACLVLAQVLATVVIVPRRPSSALPEGYFASLPPGEMVGILVLGGFRGLATDLLWLRAIGAKDDGRFYESVAVFDLISRLQPRFERVWEFMSWEMAYNISHEMDDADGRWAWYLAGVEAQVRGVEQNPQSTRLMRYLAWLFMHRGEHHLKRIEAAEWSRLLDPVLRHYGDDLVIGEHGPGLSAFELAERCYRACARLAEAGIRQPAWVQRMVPLVIEKDANLHRNRSEHLAAARRFRDSLKAWHEVRDWVERPGVLHRESDGRLTIESYQRNEGRLRRRLAEYLPRLALDPTIGRQAAEAALGRDFAQLDHLLDQPQLWREQLPGSRIHWLDETDEEPR
jgi:hypothetical protein